jgi:hypothetical protein
MAVTQTRGQFSVVLIQFLCIGLLAVLLLNGCATSDVSPKRVERVDQDIFYGGVYLLAGTQDDIPYRFPSLYGPLLGSDTSLRFGIRDFVDQNSDAFSRVNLKGFGGELAPDDAIVMAFAFNAEKSFTESVMLLDDEVQNVRAYVGGAFLLQSFKRRAEGGFDIQLLGCFPFSFSCLDLVQSSASVQEAAAAAILNPELGLMSAGFNRIITNIAQRVAPVTGLGASMQIRSVSVDEKAASFVAQQFGDSDRDFAHWLAGELGAQLASKVGIPIIPYAEDPSSRNLAQMLESGEAFNIRLPEPDFAVDVELQGFSRAMARQTASESMWVYGSYATIRIVEAQTGVERWSKDVKAGALKRIAATQTVVDHSAAEFSALLELLAKIPDELMEDRLARPIVEACLR